MSPALDVPEGYKLTEVGVIPGDWEVKQISDLATVGSGEHQVAKIRRFGAVRFRGSRLRRLTSE